MPRIVLRMVALFASLIGNTNSFNLRLRLNPGTWGLVLWSGGGGASPASDYLMLGVDRQGFLHFRFNLGNGEGVLVANQTKINDGKWHRIRATRYY